MFVGGAIGRARGRAENARLSGRGAAPMLRDRSSAVARILRGGRHFASMWFESGKGDAVNDRWHGDCHSSASGSACGQRQVSR